MRYEAPVPARSLLLIAAVALATAAAAAESDARLTPIPGTGVRIAIPPGFELSHEFPGFGREVDLTSVMVTELPFPIATARESLSAEALAQRGVELHRSGSVPVDGREATLVHASQALAGMRFRKWMLLVGDETSSVLLTATTPLELESQYQEALVGALRSTRWSPGHAAPSGPAGELGFSLRTPAPLRIVTTSADALVLSDPDHGSKGALAPVVTVGASRARVGIRDLADFARERLDETVSIRDIERSAERDRELGGMPGREIEADAVDSATGRPVRVVQVLATDGSRYYLVQGIFDREEAARYAPLLEEVARSFALRASPKGARTN
jgi:hypothetical protein